MKGRPHSENRQRTETVLVRLTPAEMALVDAVRRQVGARGAGTVLRDAFMEKWRVVVVQDEVSQVLEALRGSGKAPGPPDTAPALPAAHRPARTCAGATEPMSGEPVAGR